MVVVYYRLEAGVHDIRKFKDNEEFGEWLVREVKMEPVIIIGVYDGETPFRVIEKDLENVREKIKES